MIKFRTPDNYVYVNPETISSFEHSAIQELVRISLKNGSSFLVDEPMHQIIKKYKAAGYTVWEEDSQDEKREKPFLQAP